MDHYDVVVAGGGIGGVSAALGAAKAGARTLLIEKYGFLGGAATISNVLAFCGLYERGGTPIPRAATRGASDLVFRQIDNLGVATEPRQNPKTGHWLVYLEPESLKLALDRSLATVGADVLFHAKAVDVVVLDRRLNRVVLHCHEGRVDVEATSFVDATGDAHIAMLAGVPRTMGDGLGNLQPYSAPIRIGGIPDGYMVDRALLAAALADYNKTGAYPTKRERAGFFAPIPNSRDIWWMIIDCPAQSATSQSLSDAERHAREAAQDYVDVLRLSQPGCKDAFLVQTGPQVGIRESWHVEAECRITEDDLLHGRTRADGVARAAWPMEDHAIMGRPKFIPVGGNGFAHIPFGALKAKGVSNLYLAGRTIGSDPKAYTSVRVMGTAFATGFASGIAAAHPTDPIDPLKARIQELGGLI